MTTLARADSIADHPAGPQLAQTLASAARAKVEPTGLTRADYLTLIAGNVDFFKQFQDDAGRIVDPVSKGERQYSTPAFALAAGLLARDAKRDDLLLPATRAMTAALDALVDGRAADDHSDFYAPLLVHARRVLKDLVPADQLRRWDERFAQIEPERLFSAKRRHMNWNVVSCAGELLRRADGLIAANRRDAQWAYLETCLAGHLPAMTRLGLFEDPNAPMAYDAFTRLWLDDVYAEDAYATGTAHATIGTFLETGGLSTLLLLSPSGEWIAGGRSALHNWNEAQLVAICEIHAARWKARGRDDVAGAFKRAAHVAFQSMQSWQRPTGELWIVKNRFEPASRFAFESYSNHSQYNLLPMAMLAIAHARADETIAERAMPSEVGGYVFDVRDRFHKIIAAAGGYYVAIDTAADAKYEATGLQRVHRAGVPFSALSDTAASDRSYAPLDAAKRGLALGVQWRTTEDGPWIALSDFAGDAVRTELAIEATTPERTTFAVTYTLRDGPTVTERYDISAAGVTQRSDVTAARTRLHWPALTHDGAAAVAMVSLDDGIAVTHGRSTTIVRAGAATLGDARFVTHQGFVREATTADGATTATITLDAVR